MVALVGLLGSLPTVEPSLVHPAVCPPSAPLPFLQSRKALLAGSEKLSTPVTQPPGAEAQCRLTLATELAQHPYCGCQSILWHILLHPELVVNLERVGLAQQD